MRRPRFTVPRLMIAAAVTLVVVWLWLCTFAGLEDDDVAFVIIGGCFGFPALGLVAALFVLAMKVSPSDPPPPDSRTTALPQFTIGCLMAAVAVAGVAFALLVFALRR